MAFDQRAWSRQWMARLRRQRLAAGLCMVCGQVPVTRFQSCAPCRAKKSAWLRQRRQQVTT
jgi:uncharacterized OB-fold protein